MGIGIRFDRLLRALSGQKTTLSEPVDASKSPRVYAIVPIDRFRAMPDFVQGHALMLSSMPRTSSHVQSRVGMCRWYAHEQKALVPCRALRGGMMLEADVSVLRADMAAPAWGMTKLPVSRISDNKRPIALNEQMFFLGECAIHLCARSLPQTCRVV